jgi:exodeoxyribonuclease VII large subunit
VEELIGARGFELVAVRLAEAGRRVAQVGASLSARAGTRLADARSRYTAAAEALNRGNPVARLMVFNDRLAALSARLPGAWREAAHARNDAWRRRVERGERPLVAGLAAAVSRLDVAGGRLGALSPLASIGRGYSICRTSAGEVVRSVRQVRPGDALSVLVADGTIDAGVVATKAIDRDRTAGKEVTDGD